jgi:hypothetical protein
LENEFEQNFHHGGVGTALHKILVSHFPPQGNKVCRESEFMLAMWLSG